MAFREARQGKSLTAEQAEMLTSEGLKKARSVLKADDRQGGGVLTSGGVSRSVLTS
jgi:hypothetical protein